MRIAARPAGRHLPADLGGPREQVAEAEREDVRLYNAALSDGWSAAALRRLGLAEPEKRARTRGRRGGEACG